MMEISSEIIGGMKNAIIRGESIEKAKQSFLNAGYKKEEVEEVVQMMSTTRTPEPIIQQPIAQKLPKTVPTSKTEEPKKQQKVSTSLKIILGVSIFLILVAAALLGIFWNKLI